VVNELSSSACTKARNPAGLPVRLATGPRRLVLLICALLPMPDLAVAAEPAATALAAPYRAPYTPASDAEILQKVPAAADTAMREIDALRARLNADPGNFSVAEALARDYIEYGRKVGDARYMGYAEAVLAPWLGKSPPPVTALVQQATILQYRHEFAAARTMLQRALKASPRNTQAWLLLASLDMLQGDYRSAADDCSQVARTGGITMGLACSGNLRSYIGQAEQSLTLLAQVDAETAKMPASFRGWVQGLQAESAERLGQWNKAEAHYQRALALTPNDNFLLVAYADFLLDRGRPKEVLGLLNDFAESDTTFLRLALAHAALRSPEADRYTWIMAARFAAYIVRGTEFYGREQARFVLRLQHDPQAALVLATRNWEVQRAPQDVRVLLEAAQAAGQPKAALPVLTFLRQTGLQDPLIEPLARDLEAQINRRPGSGP
jgi:tetratricopeptide (TPR) repeat protein